ncbi:MAG: flagellar type III secretion system pore protein FliP [Oscillospiraceae bacterium]|nr:flagellar type III secretion system pore protein FliP [Oscillospiraceae bacterium]
MRGSNPAEKNKRIKKILLFVTFLVLMSGFSVTQVSAGINIELGDLDTPDSVADSVNILMFLTVIALAPSILVLVTGFTRILIVLSFTRNAMGLQQTPPNQVLIGLALLLTYFMMSPIFARMNDEALQPYIAEEITQDEAFDRAVLPLREFMLAQMSPQDLNTFLAISNHPEPEEYEDIATEVLIPAFVLNEIKRAFIIGFFIYIPFLIIDLVVASTLMSLGMMMLPPAMVSMPFKLMIFMLVDGWGIILRTLMASFN